MATEVRRATPDDADQIAEIIGEMILEENPVGFDREWTDDEIIAWMERQGDQGTMLVLDDGRHILGFAALDFDSSEPEECSFGSWIRERNRRQGYGTALANEALAFARDHGYKRIRARLPRDNEPALSYLSSIGAMVPLRSPGTRFELPVYQDGDA
jgi:RimJ/RimL family protein N-acetyltransferase